MFKTSFDMIKNTAGTQLQVNRSRTPTEEQWIKKGNNTGMHMFVTKSAKRKKQWMMATHTIVRFKYRNCITAPMTLCGAECREEQLPLTSPNGYMCSRCESYDTWKYEQGKRITIELKEDFNSTFEEGFEELITVTQVRRYCTRNNLYLPLYMKKDAKKKIANGGTGVKERHNIPQKKK